jgi:hypothetical protein
VTVWDRGREKGEGYQGGAEKMRQCRKEGREGGGREGVRKEGGGEDGMGCWGHHHDG